MITSTIAISTKVKPAWWSAVKAAFIWKVLSRSGKVKQISQKPLPENDRQSAGVLASAREMLLDYGHLRTNF